MPERPAHCYRYFDTPPYTRLEYIKSIPQPKITRFEYGNPKGNFNKKLTLVPLEAGQIRHNALEAARIITTKYLSAKIGENNYYMRIRVFPHHILRENKMMAFAGADRLQDGMRKAFGKPVSRAARVKPFQPIIEVYVPEDKVEVAKEALRRASSKLPMPSRILE
ncbi:MAG: 50S ribosomal protein L16 [Candidatus Methanomethylicia archaeon]|jgi:large subunit ribosomal protein L10e|uniref:Large ribosomal subunit protein uL16 n=1 Tax=Thermoproteota archaeon TaxID=2056631 RepID=A0A523B9V1_9CREN|nr:50S ribosomal protein L16 [Candidatus Methanomethylicia archaeon]MCQ5340248.1 50S ribosomal protein L16 [Candidatus Methanomethylicia archaeon]NHV45197.1 50S ribosomal protein L16 [Candidatus Verstraetearchaeota archaeon]RZN57404.1 MAG: 50S ribosomal protein L16 [Candidatus Verstraetearchaeota archaeon]TDA37713.1 MAG: 50S ribosomal protein L16 [Candidatus Verstraetearchaeota archaeon]